MFKIGSFNCLNLGMGASKDIATFADIILKEQFDIIALQEIKGQNALNRVLSRLPSYWVGIADDDSRSNDYAFVWNSRKFCLANAEEQGLQIDSLFCCSIIIQSRSKENYKLRRIQRKASQ